MNTEAIQKLIDLYKSDILKDGGKDMDHYLMIVCLQVERETRAGCSQIAFDAANRINNSNRS